MKNFSCLLLITLLCSALSAQPVYDYYSTGGQAMSTSVAPCNQLTIQTTGSAGAAWINYNLTADPAYFLSLDPTRTDTFDQTFDVYFGNNNYAGADGQAFVIRDTGSSKLGGEGSGIGYGYGNTCGPAFNNCFIDNSIAIEIDTHPNGGKGDPADDHIAIQLDGNEDHNTNNVGGVVTLGDIEDGKTHQFRIQIIPVGGGDFRFNAYFDDILNPVITTVFTNAQIASIFNDPTNVVWGITAATGGLTAVQLFGQPQFCDSFLQTLPVSLLAFEAAPTPDGSVQLDWSTSEEINNAAFQVQRLDGQEWRVIADLRGAGTTEIRQFYQFTDENPLVGANRYRLRQIDFDGQVSLSEQVEVSVQNLSNVRLFPNPTTGMTTLFLPEASEQSRAVVFDMRGSKVASYELTVGTNDLNLAGIPSGMYVVQIQGTEAIFYAPQRLVVR